ncbi:YbjN domain-containing protein [Sphingomonas sp.]|uniref:YbjN domain-containing protein n=1 Tax=Sphingomonas sp. TaxID=28214 RepID=UPI001B08DDF1|nr:YbjN domain-containing protein [Sphingomonas sp.]MBO9712096.1 YbjN domain-containing protein [Sphingomonas sp.]
MIGYRSVFAALIFSAGMIAAAPVQAQAITADPSAVAGFLRGQGATADVKTDKDGDPLIEASLGENQKFSVYFYNCTNHAKCQSVQFYAGYTDSKVDAAKLNDWNRTKRFGRAYIDGVGDPVVEMDVDMQGGMPRPLFEDNYKFWLILMKQFPDFVYAE